MWITDGGVNDDCILLQENEDLREGHGRVRREPQNQPWVSCLETVFNILDHLHLGLKDVT